jgi:hypothetical protein
LGAFYQKPHERIALSQERSLTLEFGVGSFKDEGMTARRKNAHGFDRCPLQQITD